MLLNKQEKKKLPLEQRFQADSTKGRVAAGFCSNQSSTHGRTNQLSEVSDQFIKWAQSGVFGWLEQKPAATRPFVESVWHPCFRASPLSRFIWLFRILI